MSNDAVLNAGEQSPAAPKRRGPQKGWKQKLDAMKAADAPAPAVAGRAPERTEQRKPQRARRQAVDQNPYSYDKNRRPDGMSYEFKRATYGGKEDVKHQSNMMRNGFTAVPAARHPELVGEKFAREHPDEAIVIDGLMLMERPAELRQEADTEYLQTAKAQVQNQFKTLKVKPDGQFARDYIKASRKYDIPVPEGSDYTYDK